MKLGDDKTRAAAQAAISKVCRIGTHLFHLAEAVNSLGGWGRGTKRAFRNWYMDKPHQSTAMQLIKYQQRDGWSHRDILRLIHPESKNDVQAAMFRYTIAGMDGMGQRTITRKVKGEDKVFEYPAINPSLLPRVIEGFEKAKQAKSDTEIVKLIEEYGLPRECVPTMFLNSPDVWRALLLGDKGMPFTAMLRNLAKMTAIGLLRPMSSEVKYVCSKLRDATVIKQARTHPLNILIALRTYASGHGVKGSLTWTLIRRSWMHWMIASTSLSET
jgi:60 kDa SS-A/Ro ribonucleoprotein